jgi:hypothetical protein
MIADLTKLCAMVDRAAAGEALTELDRLEALALSQAVFETARRIVTEYAENLSALTEVLASLDFTAHPALRDKIADIVTHHRDPGLENTPKVTPSELLKIAARHSAMGDPHGASRLRRLADDMAASPSARMPEGSLLISELIWLKPHAVSGIKDHMSERYGLESIEARPLWAKLFEIATGISVDVQQALVELGVGGEL